MDCPLCNKFANYSDHLQRQMSQQKVPFAKDGHIGMIRSFTKTRYCHWPSFLQEPIQAHPDHLQKPNVLPNRPLCKDLQKQNVIMYAPLCNWLASPHSSNHLQRQMSQRTVPFTKDGPIQMIQIICKNKVLSLAILFARANSTLSGSFAKTKCGAIQPYFQKLKKKKFHHRVTNQPLFNELVHLQKPNFVLDPIFFWQRFD